MRWDGLVTSSLSPRLRAAVEALPLRPGLRVLEVGGGGGALAEEVLRRIAPGGHLLLLDRSPTAARTARARLAAHVDAGTASVRCAAVEDLALAPGEEPYDLAVAVRVGALDGRHPGAAARALPRLAAALRPDGLLLVGDGGELRRVRLS